LARVEQEMVGIGLHKIEYLLNEQSQSSQWDKRLSKTLFEMLVPNEFKNTFRNQGNMIIKLDKNAAQLPWELLHDKEVDDTPACVTSSFIRQLVTEDSPNFTQVALNNNNAFIVGDPEYGREDLPQLPAAKAEAEWVSARLNKGGYSPTLLVNNQASNIMMELFNKQYKILHFAGHGLYAPEDGDVGIAIGNGICIDPAMINQIGYVPEFVFINCCYSGAINAEDDRYSKERYRLAANVGTQLIEMGVKAIVISGWAVDDAAAKTFAETFYENMFEGYDFGSAVQKARLACYQNHSGTNTWGAYQCYGNQFYKFNNRKKSKKKELEYVIASQVHTDMDNLLIAIRDREHDTKTTLQKLDHYLDKAEQANLLDAVVLEKEALIYDELGKFDIALRKFKELFRYDNGNFSIEALEQYCVIKAHHLNKKTLVDDLKEVEFLTLVGKNPSRLNIVGNAYKMASLQVEGKHKITHLEKAFDYYEAAYKASNDKYDGNFLDAVTNMIFIGHILELIGGGKLVDRIKACDAFENVTDITKYLTDFHEELEEFDKSNLDVSVLIGIAETSYGLMLLKSNFKPNIELDIIAKFNHIFQLLYSPRYIYAEIIQVDFLLHYIKDDVIREQLSQIKNEIKKLLT
jgi:tetratricopeptide (TPR) repeat protein